MSYYIRATIHHIGNIDKPILEVPTTADFNAQSHETKLSKIYGLDVGLPYLVPLTNEQISQFSHDYGVGIGAEADARILSDRLTRNEANGAVIGVKGELFAPRTLQRHLQAVNRPRLIAAA